MAITAEEPPGEKQEHGNGCLIREARDTAFLLTGEEREHGVRGGCELALRVVRDRNALARPTMCAECFDRLRCLARGRDPDSERLARRQCRAPGRGELGNAATPRERRSAAAATAAKRELPIPMKTTWREPDARSVSAASGELDPS